MRPQLVPTPSVVPAKAGTQGWRRAVDEKRPCVYILASKRNGPLYAGVTSDVVRRVWEHCSNAVAGFTQQYKIYTLVYAEFHETMESAISREKPIKRWKRAWKLELIEDDNPQWHDLYDGLAS
ncbi:MAG TPA: GIY-YIG nuclease family protein [Stellaceae bacterium]|jgi:putative endonuclease|nr:GIY-YIG nuclease family protein [Stellaceae bacterium]